MLRLLLSILLVTISGSALAASVAPSVVEHNVVYYEEGRFGGWPANYGMWIWDDEILVGYSKGWYKDLGERHHIDRERPEEFWHARSLDGGKTWSHEHPAEKGDLIPEGAALHGTEKPGQKIPPTTDCPGGIDFTHPDFAFTFRMNNIQGGISRFYYSYDRGKDWEGPFNLPNFGSPGTAARTDFIVHDKHDATFFITVAKANAEEGRVIAVRTKDGCKTWEKLGDVGPEPEIGFSIMPSSVQLDDGTLLTATRRRLNEYRWNDLYRSLDGGKTWHFMNRPVRDAGIGNPPAMNKLQDGRLCITYGFRAEPFSICAVFSEDDGVTWSEPFVLRDDGLSRDVGYVRTVQREDGKLLTTYYFCGGDVPGPERYIGATLWDPGKP